MFWNGNLYLAPCSYYPISDTCREASNLGASSPQVGSVVDSGRVAEPLSGLNCSLKIPNSLHLFKIIFPDFFWIFQKLNYWYQGPDPSLWPSVLFNDQYTWRRNYKKKESGGGLALTCHSPPANTEWVCWKKTGLWVTLAVMWALTKNCHTIHCNFYV